MTEAEWLRSEDPAKMLRFVTENPDHQNITCVRSERKLRFFACAVCRAAWDLLTDERSRRAVEVAERVADDQADEYTDMLPAVHQAYAAWSVATNDLAFLPWAACGSSIEATLGNNWWVVTRRFGPPFAAQAALLRDIFGNPFRPGACACPRPEWATSGRAWGEAVAIARQAYNVRDFSALPVLADALEEAGCPPDMPCPGCENATEYRIYGDCCQNARHAGRVPNSLLAHLRGPGPHARGCWALDLILGKS